MKRDLDFCKEILEAIEKGPIHVSGPEIVRAFENETRPREMIEQHVKLLIQADLLTVLPGTESRGNPVGSVELTWVGHEFLDQAQNPENWSRAKKVAGSFGLEAVKTVLAELVKQGVRSVMGGATA